MNTIYPRRCKKQLVTDCQEIDIEPIMNIVYDKCLVLLEQIVISRKIGMLQVKALHGKVIEAIIFTVFIPRKPFTPFDYHTLSSLKIIFTLKY